MNIKNLMTLTIVLATLSLILTGCSENVEAPPLEQPDSTSQPLESTEPLSTEGQSPPENPTPKTTEAQTDENQDEAFTDIMEGERMMFLEAERKFNEAAARRKAEEDAKNK